MFLDHNTPMTMIRASNMLKRNSDPTRIAEIKKNQPPHLLDTNMRHQKVIQHNFLWVREE
jgi:hypothetical protein